MFRPIGTHQHSQKLPKKLEDPMYISSVLYLVSASYKVHQLRFTKSKSLQNPKILSQDLEIQESIILYFQDLLVTFTHPYHSYFGIRFWRLASILHFIVHALWELFRETFGRNSGRQVQSNNYQEMACQIHEDWQYAYTLKIYQAKKYIKDLFGLGSRTGWISHP